MNLRWDDLRLFLAVYEQGSLSAAARALKIGQPTVSRRIAEFEAMLGEPVFERLSQGVSLTVAGQRLLPAVQSMAEWANEAELGASRQGDIPEGKVRIAAPPGIAYEFIAPLAAKLRQQYPGIRIEAMSGIETLNLGRGEADLSLRNRKPTDADLLCVDEVSSAMRVYASESYARRLGARPALADLDWICWAAPYDELPVNQELRAAISGFRPAFTSDDFNVQVAACKAGVGAMILPQLIHRYAGLRELQVLRELAVDLGQVAVGHLYLVCHKRRRHLPMVQLVMDCIAREFEGMR